MKTKTMTIPEFMEMQRVKEINTNNIDKKEYYILALLLILLSITTLAGIQTGTVTAFHLSTLSCF